MRVKTRQPLRIKVKTQRRRAIQQFVSQPSPSSEPEKAVLFNYFNECYPTFQASNLVLSKEQHLLLGRRACSITPFCVDKQNRPWILQQALQRRYDPKDDLVFHPVLQRSVSCCFQPPYCDSNGILCLTPTEKAV